MKIRGVKQLDLANLVGVTESTMSRFLNGGINFKQNNIETLLKFLNIELVITENKC